MSLSNAQKKVISNIFRDLAKLSIMTLVIGQFSPEKTLSLPLVVGGTIASVFMAGIAIGFAVK